ncbi:MAG: rhodanese-like domain-containing protein [Bacteroidetes bacterium]|nr:rhodanese-like domain-containing protein [Bacteroidota bacterium]
MRQYRLHFLSVSLFTVSFTRLLILTLFFFSVFTLFGCRDGIAWEAVERMIERDYPAAQPLSTDSLHTWLGDETVAPPVLLDVRKAEEYAVSHLEGAMRVDPNTTDFTFLADRTRETPIVAYCSVGYRSAAIAERLQEAGFTNVYNLHGSIFEWANNGYPVVRDGKVVDEVHPYDRLWGQLLERSYRTYEAGN